MTTRRTDPIEYSDEVVEAVSHYLRRQARIEHPAGRFDKGGRFSIAEACGRDCRIRPPSRAYPYSQLVHGRTLTHVCGVLRADEKLARQLLRSVDAK